MDTKKLRQKILDLAIHGKLVPQDPNDEPASVLLERIRVEKERLIAEGKIKRSKKSATSDTPHYENVPFEVPENWLSVRVEDVCIFESGFAFNSELYKTKGQPIVRISNIKEGFVDLDGCVYVDPVEDSRFEVNSGDLLIAMSGATTGKMGIYKNNSPALLNQRVGNIKTISNKILISEYRNLIMQSLEPQIIKDAYGGAQPNISAKNICAYRISLPPLQEQQRIVNVVEQCFSLINSIETGRDVLKQYIGKAKSKILDLAIHGKLVPQDANDGPASELLKRINPKAVASCNNPHYADIPESWVECKLGDVCSFESGYAYSSEMYKSMGIPLIRISNIVDGFVNIEDCVYIKGDELSKNVQVKQGDLLIAMSGATTGKIGIYTYPDGAILNQRVGNIKVKEHCILSTGYRDLFINAIKVEIEKKAYGGAQPNISGKMICNFSFSLPPYKEQLRIVSKVNDLFSQLDMIEKSLQA